MITNDTTQHLGLPLPSPDNELEDDVLRLRAALAAIDELLLALQQGLAQRATSAGVTVINNALQQAITTLSNGTTDALTALDGRIDTLESSSIFTVNGKSPDSHALTLLPSDIGAMATGQDGWGGAGLTSVADCNAAPARNLRFSGDPLTNAPGTGAWVIDQVLYNTDWRLQIACGASAGNAGRVFLRQRVNGAWRPWVRLGQQTEDYVDISAANGAIDCQAGSLFYLSMTGDVTLSINNPPQAGAGYVGLLEIAYTAGALTRPAGSTLSGSAQMLSGKRYLLLFNRSQSGAWQFVLTQEFS